MIRSIERVWHLSLACGLEKGDNQNRPVRLACKQFPGSEPAGSRRRSSQRHHVLHAANLRTGAPITSRSLARAMRLPLFDRCHVEVKLNQAISEQRSRLILSSGTRTYEHLDLHSAMTLTDRYSEIAVQRWGARTSTHSPERSPAATASAFASSV